MKTNVLYLTNKCNLKCEYCYQRHDPNSLSISIDEVRAFADEIVAREGTSNPSTIVLFGGEPLLLKYKIFDVLDVFESYEKDFAISLVTNGIAFLDSDFFKSFYNKIKSLKNHFSLEISYDGVGSSRRIYHDGKSAKEDIEKVLALFDPSEISIRYTIHKGNYRAALRDLIELQSKKYKKIIVNFYESEIEKDCDINVYKDTLRRQMEYTYTKYKVPVCYLNCALCRGCNFGAFDGINYQSKLSVSGNAEEFKHFELLKQRKEILR